MNRKHNRRGAGTSTVRAFRDRVGISSNILFGGRSRSSRLYWDGGGDSGGSGGTGGATEDKGGATDDKSKVDDKSKEQQQDEDPLANLDEKQKAALQKKLDEVAGKARTEGKTKGKEERDNELKREQEKTDQANKEKQGEFEKLYNELKPKYEAAEQKAKDYDTLAEQFHKQLDDEIKAWPASVREADPGKDEGLESRRKWVERNRKLATELAAAQKGVDGEHGAGGGQQQRKTQATVYKPNYHRPGGSVKK